MVDGWTGSENQKKSCISKISRILFDIFFLVSRPFRRVFKIHDFFSIFGARPSTTIHNPPSTIHNPPSVPHNKKNLGSKKEITSSKNEIKKLFLVEKIKQKETQMGPIGDHKMIPPRGTKILHVGSG